MSLASGTQLGRYEIRSKIGQGGMGQVYLATDTELHRKVAIKILPENLATNEQRLRRFVREARAASALNHPHILTIHEIGSTGNTKFIATEFIDGETLRERIRGTPLPLIEILEIAIQVTSALAAAHSAGIVHRDIKPDNVMVRRDGYVKLVDFGLAKLTAAPEIDADPEAPTREMINTADGVAVGTANYMSPEQASGTDVDGRTDLWSFGVVLYEMTTGRLPFTGTNQNQIIAEILSNKLPPPPSRYSGELTPELERIIIKALAKDKDERYQTAKDLHVDLRRLKKQLESRVTTEDSEDAKQSRKTVQATVPQRDKLGQMSGRLHAVSGYRAWGAGAILLLAIAIVGFSLWNFRTNSPTPRHIESIAVMPFKNESGNPELEYLADGITETLISTLSQVPNVNVKARSSVFRFKGRETSATDLGKELNVQAILYGHVAQRGNQFALNLELVDAATENALWNSQYTRNETDLITLQNEIARDVVGKLKATVSGAAEPQLSKQYTANIQAYHLYLKGRFYWNKRTAEDLRRSIKYFQDAISSDPNYALAYAGLADAYNFLGAFGIAATPPKDAMPEAKAAALKALEFDEKLSEAHASLAFVKFYYEWQWQEAEKEFRRAIDLNPNYPLAHQWYSHLLMASGRTDESIAQAKSALELDPLALPTNMNYGWQLFFAGRYDEAIDQLRKTLEMEPNFAQGHWALGLALEQKKMFAEAGTEFQKAAALSESNATYIAALAHSSAASGKKSEALKLLSDLNRRSGEYVPPYWMAAAYAALDEKNLALDWLDKAYQERSGGIVWLKVEPKLNPLREESRFKNLVQKVFPQ